MGPPGAAGNHARPGFHALPLCPCLCPSPKCPNQVCKPLSSDPQKLDKEEAARKQRQHDSGQAMARKLEEQMKERDAAKEAQRREDEVGAVRDHPWQLLLGQSDGRWCQGGVGGVRPMG